MLEEVIQMGISNPKQAGDLLPQQYSILKTDFRKRHSFFFISDMIEEVFKSTPILGDVDDNSSFGQCLEIGRLRGVYMNIGKHRLKNQG